MKIFVANISEKKRKAIVGVILCLAMLAAISSIWYVEPRLLHSHILRHTPVEWAGICMIILLCRRVFFLLELKLYQFFELELPEDSKKYWEAKHLF